MSKPQSNVQNPKSKSLNPKPVLSEVEGSPELYRLLFATASEAILVLQNGGESGWEVVDGNPSAAVLLGCTRENLLGQSLLAFCPPTQPDGRGSAKVLADKIAAALTGESQRFEWLCRRRDQSEFYAHLALSVAEFEDATLLQVSLQDISTYKQAEEALRASEARYRELVQNANSIILQFDPAGCITFINEFGQQFFGYTAEELIGQNVIGTIVPSTDTAGQDLAAMLRDLVQHPEQYATNENENVRRNGQRVWISWTNKALVDAAGHLTGIFCIGQDITARVRAEQALRQMQFVVEDSPAVLFRWRAAASWPVEFVSENIAQFGYAPAELLTGETPYASLVHPDDLERVAQEVQQYSASGVDQFPQEYRIVTKDGQVRWTDDRTVIERDAEGNITCYQGIVLDITERKLTEQNLQESQERFRALFESSPDGIVLIDPHSPTVDWAIVDCNEVFCRMNGYQREELIGRTIDVLHQGRAEPQERAAYLERLRGEGHLTVEAVHLHKDGSLFPIESSTSLISLAGREMVLGIDRDVTGRKRLEQALQGSERRLADIIEFLPSPTFAIDKEGEVIAWNQALADVTGVKADEILGKGNYEYALPFFGERRPLLIDLIYKSDEEIAKLYTNVWRDGSRLHAENRVFVRGIERIYALSAGGLYDSQGNLVGAIETFRDITEQKQAEEALRQYQDQLEELVEARTAELEDRVRELNELQRLMSREGWQGFQATRKQAAPGYLFDQAAVRPVEREESEPSTNGRSEAKGSVEPIADKSTRSWTVTRPLAVFGESIGTLGIYDDDPDNPLSPEDQTFLDEIAVQVAEALERARLLEQTQASLVETEVQAERLTLLSELGQELAQTTAIDDALNIAATRMELIVDSDLVGIGLFDETTQKLESYALVGGQGAQSVGMEVTVAGSMFEIVIREQQLLTIPDLQVRDEIDVGAWLEQGMRSAMVAPLVTSGQVIGTVHAGSRKLNAYTEQDGRLMLQIASLLASNLESRRLFEETQAALAEVEATQRRYTLQAWEAYRARKTAKSYEQNGEGVLPLGDELPPEVGQALVQKKALAISAAPASDGGQAPSAGAKSSLVVPLTVRDETIGVLGLQETAEARQWTPEEIAVVEAIAEQVAQAAENLRLFDETQQRAAREQRVGEIGDKIRAAQSLEEALQVAIKEVGLSLKAPHTTVQLEVK